MNGTPAVEFRARPLAASPGSSDAENSEVLPEASVAVAVKKRQIGETELSGKIALEEKRREDEYQARIDAEDAEEG